MFSPKYFRVWDWDEKRMLYGDEAKPVAFAGERYVPMQLVCGIKPKKKKKMCYIFEGDVITQHPFSDMTLPVVVAWNPKALGFAGLPLWSTNLTAERPITLERIVDGSAMNEAKIVYNLKDVFGMKFELVGNIFETDWEKFLPKST